MIRDKRDTDKERSAAGPPLVFVPPTSADELPTWWSDEQEEIPSVFVPRYDKTNSRRQMTYAFRFVAPPQQEVEYWGSGRTELDKRTRWKSQVILTKDPRWETSQLGRTLDWWLPHSLYRQVFGYAKQEGWDPHDPAITWTFTIKKRGAHAPPQYTLKSGKKEKK